MWSDTSADSTGPLPSDVRRDELVCTFVVRPGDVVKKTNSIHYTRLMPRRRGKQPRGRLETSVCRASNLTEAQFSRIYSEYFDKYAPKPAIGRGVGPAEAVFSVGLAFDADGMPYPEHANIVGWHDMASSSDSELKHFWMDQAQRMAPRFTYVPRR